MSFDVQAMHVTRNEPRLTVENNSQARTQSQSNHHLFPYPQTLNIAIMKRKLDANDVPVPAGEVAAPKEETTFASLGLDPRLLQGIAKQNFQTPTLVQTKAIPLALEGRDVLARAKTGSGKTAAYLLPIIHSVLKRKEVGSRITLPALKLTSSGRHHLHNLQPL